MSESIAGPRGQLMPLRGTPRIGSDLTWDFRSDNPWIIWDVFVESDHEPIGVLRGRSGCAHEPLSAGGPVRLAGPRIRAWQAADRRRPLGSRPEPSEPSHRSDRGLRPAFP